MTRLHETRHLRSETSLAEIEHRHYRAGRILRVRYTNTGAIVLILSPNPTPIPETVCNAASQPDLSPR